MFVFRPGSRVAGVDAEVAGAELERIREETGVLMPDAVVEESRPKDAPLHPAFEWDNKRAGQAWRVHQARNLIRAIQVVQDGELRAPVYVNVRPESGADPSYYQAVSAVVQNPDELQRAIGLLTEKLHAAQSALADIQRLAGERGPEAAALVAIAASALATARDAVQKIN